MAKSSIEWTEMTWNPTTGCNKISAGCKYCYAEVLSKRLMHMGVEKYKDAFQVRLHEKSLNMPYQIKKPTIFFVNSMSDLFHKDIPLSYIKKVFEVMNNNPKHTFQVLTKRAERLQKLSSKLTWSSNIWAGVSVENKKTIFRIHHLQKTLAKVKFLSCEPLLENIENLPLKNIDWVIVGGESGPKARPMKKQWVENIQRQCERKNILFFFKQWGGTNKKKTGRILNGKTYDGMPNKVFSAV